MKVLKPGRPQKGWSIQTKCSGSGNGGGGCGAKLLVEEGDLFMTECHPYGDDLQRFVTFKCVDCGVLTDIPFNSWPPAKIVDKLKVKNDL